jgi:hypothetical protein
MIAMIMSKSSSQDFRFVIECRAFMASSRRSFSLLNEANAFVCTSADAVTSLSFICSCSNTSRMGSGFCVIRTAYTIGSLGRGGDDVFFATSAKLMSEDYDKGRDVYDTHARSAVVPCEEEVVRPPVGKNRSVCEVQARKRYPLIPVGRRSGKAKATGRKAIEGGVG